MAHTTKHHQIRNSVSPLLSTYQHGYRKSLNNGLRHLEYYLKVLFEIHFKVFITYSCGKKLLDWHDLRWRTVTGSSAYTLLPPFAIRVNTWGALMFE